MKKIKPYRFLLSSICFLFSCISGFAQNQVAYANWNWAFSNASSNPVQVKSSEGTVCDYANPVIYNYYTIAGKQVVPGGVSWNDSEFITNAAKNTATQMRFKAIAGKPLVLTLDLHLAYGIGVINAIYVNSIENNVVARTGTLGRHTENGSNPQYDNVQNLTKAGDPVFNGFNEFHYTYTGTFVFKRGSEAGYIFITVPTKNYDGQTRYEEFIVPYLVSGALDEQVKHLGYTTEPRIPYMVLHDPPGDGSNATLSTTTKTCRSMEESYSSDESNSIFGTVKLGVKGSIGFVATIDYEIFAEFSAGATIGDLKMGNTATESCIAISKDISTSSLNPEANTSDLFIGYGMDMWYAVTDNLAFDGCSYKISKSLIYQPKDGTTTEFVYTKQDILDDIAAQQASLSSIAQTQPVDSLRRRDSARIIYQVNVWNQVLSLNDSNKAHPDESAPATKNFSFGSGQTYAKTVDITQSRSITVEHYIDAEAGLQGVVNVGGSGFSLGYKFTTSKRFGNTSTSQGSTSETVSYSLSDDDPGDAFSVRILSDPMYGTPVFQTLPGTKSSCPYEGGIQRDQPRLEHMGTTDSAITYPNVPVNDYQSFDLKICNDAAEPRAYRLRLKNNNGNLIVTAGGNEGPEFNTVSGIALGAKGSATECVTYQVDVHQRSLSSLSFPDLEFELYDVCDDGISKSVFATINYGSLVKSTSSGNWNNIASWEAKRVPQPTDSVIINNNHTITILDGSDVKCKTVMVNPNSNLIISKTAKLTVKEP